MKSTEKSKAKLSFDDFISTKSWEKIGETKSPLKAKPKGMQKDYLEDAKVDHGGKFSEKFKAIVWTQITAHRAQGFKTLFDQCRKMNLNDSREWN